MDSMMMLELRTPNAIQQDHVENKTDAAGEKRKKYA